MKNYKTTQWLVSQSIFSFGQAHYSFDLVKLNSTKQYDIAGKPILRNDIENMSTKL